MSRFTLCLALLCAFAQSARALQLGETREQMIARHGAPGAEDHAKHLAMYFWEGWSAQLEFQDNVVCRLTYRRNWYLQEAEINSLLQSNGGASRWHEVSTAGAPTRHWMRDDGAAASCNREKPLSIVFQAAGFTAAEIAEPKVLFPKLPETTPGRLPNYPRMLNVPEPDLPVADPPAPSPEPPVRPLPKLPAAEIQPDGTTTPIVTEPAPSATPAAPEPAVVTTQKAPAETASPTESSTGGSHTLAYVLSGIVLLGAAGGGFFYWRKRKPQVGRKMTVPTRKVEILSESLGALPGASQLRTDQFELLIAELFRRQGYTVEISAAMSTDDAIDLTLRRDSETILVQCKHWKAARVGEEELHEFNSAMASCGAPRGVFITTGGFSTEAQVFAASNGIDLMGGSALAERIAAVTRPGEDFFHIAGWLDEFASHARIFDPECPNCHGTMVIRNNRTNGAPSWSCRSYPRCPGRREPRLDLLPHIATH